jgi:hypothetical protein
MNKRSYWIKKRYNPQFDRPYYSACGQLGKREAKRKEDSLYGFNEMLEFVSAEDYQKAIEQFKAGGYTVYD